tara:strand:+ start:1586 stop:2182 length:597 start_codon:yes stop_codon:yes gene_type:complete
MIELNIQPIPPVNIDDDPIDWELVDIDNISGRLNVMWLTPEGIGISTRIYSHMAILNMVCEKSKKQDFWDIEEIKKHYVNVPNKNKARYDVDDPVQLGRYKESFPNNNLVLAEYMENFMRRTKWIRVSGPYRNVEFGGSTFGHALKLLEKREFVYEYFGSLTKPQRLFINKVISVYNLQENEIYRLNHDVREDWDISR